ncbi:MAG: hypothetical protein KF850_21630 [Labilithrix sp.]|nr:hypothetical protein [Labilithrix sp.]
MALARWLLVVIPLGVAACHTSGTTRNVPAGQGTLTAADANLARGPAAAEAERMPLCPSAVDGARTSVTEVAGGVELAITAPGEGAREIRRRASALSAAAEETRGKHQGSGAGRARFGRCPVVMRNTKVAVREIPGGAAVVLAPSNAAELAWLRREVEARAAQLATPKLFGLGLMKTCPSAVPNALTTVTSAPYGVDVRVTESTPAGTKAIRERAKELAAHPVGDERCPASAPNATLAVTEVPGGVKIAIKAKQRDDVAGLRQSVNERARSYEPATSP